jgi:protein O-mannosyl-transferase
VPPKAAAFAIIALTFVAYLPVILHGGFIWDDPEYLLENPFISTRVSDLLRMWVPLTTAQYYPLVFSSFWIEHNLWGLDAQGAHRAFGYHLTNVALHAASAVLAWRVFAALGVRWAWLIGALFALHPLHVESAAWITERKNVLSAFFYLLAALAYLRFDKLRDESAPEPKPWRWYAAAFGLFVLALLSKTVTCSLPAALILAMLYQRKPMTVRRLLPLAPLFVAGLALGLTTAWIERHFVGLEEFSAEQSRPLVERVLVACRAEWFYPLKLLLPAPLIFNYPRWEIDAREWTQWVPVVLFVAAAVAVVAAWRRGCRGPFVAASFYAGTIFPAVGFFYVFPHRYAWVADHFCYLASLGILALIVAGLARVLTSRAGITAVTVALLGACGVLTWLQGGNYRNEEYLWHVTAAQNPGSSMAQNNLAAMYFRWGETLLRADREAAARPLIEMAAEHAGRAATIRPDHWKAHLNRAESLTRLGRHAEAMPHFAEAMRILTEGHAADPDKLDYLPLATYNVQLGQCLEAAGLAGDAGKAYERALQRDRKHPFACFHYGQWLARTGRAELAEEYLAEAGRHLPTQTLVWDHGEFRIVRPGRREQDILDTFAAATANVEAASTGVMQSLQRVRLQVARFHLLPPRRQDRDVRKARLLIEQARAEMSGENAGLLALLALVHSEAGRAPLAVELAERAHSLSKEDEALQFRLSEQLDSYRRAAGRGQ